MWYLWLFAFVAAVFGLYDAVNEFLKDPAGQLGQLVYAAWWIAILSFVVHRWISIRRLVVAAYNGDVDAQLELVDVYATGEDVMPPDEVKAAAWCRWAAEEGDAKAQSKLGSRYAGGWGVRRDHAEAVVWYCRAAEQGDASAQFCLGNMYARGQGVTRDYTLAYMWLALAKTNGHRNAVAKHLTPSQIAEAQRLAREWSEAHGRGAE